MSGTQVVKDPSIAARWGVQVTILAGLSDRVTAGPVSIAVYRPKETSFLPRQVEGFSSSHQLRKRTELAAPRITYRHLRRRDSATAFACPSYCVAVSFCQLFSLRRTSASRTHDLTLIRRTL